MPALINLLMNAFIPEPATPLGGVFMTAFWTAFMTAFIHAFMPVFFTALSRRSTDEF
jgi:hypothetical protein